MARVAIYARYSSDLQNPRSIEDQEALCRRWCEREGHGVVATFSDAALLAHQSMAVPVSSL